MREALAPLEGQRITVTATVMRLGSRLAWTGVKEPTILLGPLHDPAGNVLADHLWFHQGARLAALTPQVGDRLTLTGRVARYHRRRKQWAAEAVRYDDDLGLVYPSRCAVLARAALEEPVKHVLHDAEPPAIVSPALPARVRILEALSALSAEEDEPPSLTKILVRAGVPPLTLLSLLKKMGNAGAITFTPTGRVLLAAIPAQSLEGSLSHGS